MEAGTCSNALRVRPLGPEKNLGHASWDSRSVIDVLAVWGIEIEPDGFRMKPKKRGREGVEFTNVGKRRGD